QRSFGLFRGLARRHDVRVLCVVPNRTRKPPEERVAEVTLLRRSVWYTSAAWRLERARLAPLFLASLAHRARARAWRDVLSGAADVCMADLPLAGVLGPAQAPLRGPHAHHGAYDPLPAGRPRAPRRRLRGRTAARARGAGRARRAAGGGGQRRGRRALPRALRRGARSAGGDPQRLRRDGRATARAFGARARPRPARARGRR